MRHRTPGMTSYQTSLIAASKMPFMVPREKLFLIYIFSLKIEVLFIMLVKELQYINDFKLKRVGLD